MFRSILVPLDGSPFSEQALPLARLLGRASETGLHLGHVQPGQGAAQPAGSGANGEETYLRKLTDSLRAEGIQADPWLLEGDVVDALETWSKDRSADLIVMATHGRAGLERLRLGSVAESLVSRGLAPMLLVHPGSGGAPEAAKKIDTAVVALDASTFAQSIVEPLVSFGEALGVSRYILLHVRDERGVGKAGWEPVSTVQVRAAEVLEDVRKRLEATGAEVEVRVVTAPEPSEGILDAAREAGADLIAMTTHGMTGVRPTLLGSVAAKVLHSWEGPLLLRRPAEGARA